MLSSAVKSDFCHRCLSTSQTLSKHNFQNTTRSFPYVGERRGLGTSVVRVFSHPQGSAGDDAQSSKRKDNSAVRRMKLPNEWELAYVSEPDVPFLYHEIFIEECYTQHGVSIGEGSMVVDVGANVGTFAMWAAVRCPEGAIVCIEPIPLIHAALEANLEWIQQHQTANGLQSARLKALNIGISDGSVREAEFTFYTGAAGWSTMFPDDNEVQEAVASYVMDALPSGRGLEKNPLTWLGQKLAASNNTVANSIIQTLTRQKVAGMLASQETVLCKIRTISEVIAQEQLQRIDLLKVDVERAELQVLKGISAADWPLIRQVVMEVHDIDGRLQEVTSLLRQNGFSKITTDQPGSMQGSALWNLFAVR
mmetsp:Transcript_16594/g.27975  ORF Transcript_16594/g.27975 Transcript_16594/m.27975 type:complete len:365 (+) Transcript_16594:243-1337(+)|eukprot:CAMPEP_0198212492 /NCGR_PEP_ID=MMETSP1445-20131203/26329_1 /TAXON_ID=36898 /ORGANISM="Pyramimonas sp., Strain CCMP2087" /LENGTH=364 /DNA_ID=CAMNT_0043886949 /DNA_START=208 /DNA_END=1302 /DNA_ORIENTATION=-